MKKKLLAIVVLIVLFSGVLRVWNLAKYPSGIQVDEIAFGYNSYSILKTAHDEYGQLLPLTLRSFDDYKAAIYAYIDVPFVALFGLTGLAVRLPTAILGIGLVGSTYLLALELTKNKKIAVVAMFLTAVSPVSIVLSRVQSEPLVATFFVILGVYLFLVWHRKQNNIYLIAGTLFWILSLFTSTIPRVFLIVFLPFLFLFHRSKKAAVSFGLVLGVSIFLFFGSSLSRYNQVSVFSSLHVQLPLEESIREDGPNQAFIARLFHNKPINYGRYLINNYFDYLSFNFLFQEANLPVREHIAGMGVMYLVELPFLAWGVWQILKKKANWGFVLVGWILLVPLAMAFASDDTPNIHRFFLGVIPLEIVVAYGLVSVNKYLRLLVVPIYIFSLAFFLHQLIVHQPVHKPYNRSYSYVDLVKTVNYLSPNYQKVVMTTKESNTYIFFLFYNKVDPLTYQLSGSKGNLNGGSFDKYEFVHEDCPKPINKNYLYVQLGNCPDDSKSRSMAIVPWNDGSAAFKIVESL